MKQVIEQLLSALAHGDEERLRACLAQDFVFEDETALATWDTDGFIAWALALKQALPDLRAELVRIQAGAPTLARVLIEGTHQRELDLSLLGAGYTPASGELIQLAPQDLYVEGHAGAIASIVATAGEHTGIGGLLEAVGSQGVVA